MSAHVSAQLRVSVHALASLHTGVPPPHAGPDGQPRGRKAHQQGLQVGEKPSCACIPLVWLVLRSFVCRRCGGCTGAPPFA